VSCCFLLCWGLIPLLLCFVLLCNSDLSAHVFFSRPVPSGLLVYWCVYAEWLGIRSLLPALLGTLLAPTLSNTSATGLLHQNDQMWCLNLSNDRLNASDPINSPATLLHRWRLVHLRFPYRRRPAPQPLPPHSSQSPLQHARPITPPLLSNEPIESGPVFPLHQTWQTVKKRKASHLTPAPSQPGAPPPFTSRNRFDELSHHPGGDTPMPEDLTPPAGASCSPQPREHKSPPIYV